jgi:hypothetical protein
VEHKQPVFTAILMRTTLSGKVTQVPVTLATTSITKFGQDSSSVYRKKCDDFWDAGSCNGCVGHSASARRNTSPENLKNRLPGIAGSQAIARNQLNYPGMKLHNSIRIPNLSS